MQSCLPGEPLPKPPGNGTGGSRVGPCRTGEGGRDTAGGEARPGSAVRTRLGNLHMCSQGR